MLSKYNVSDNEKIISNIVKVYPHMTKIVIYHNSYKIILVLRKIKMIQVKLKSLKYLKK